MSTKRYRLFSSHLKEYFGTRVHKISVDAGFGCPNRAGGRQGEGCVFCAPDGSGAVGVDRRQPVASQIAAGKEVMSRKYGANRYLAYFQPYSNTFAPVDRLREAYDQALGVPDVVGLAVGTRPDCLAEPVVDLLEEYHHRTYFWLELGLQSSHDRTLERLQRGHDYRTFEDAFRRARARGLRVCVHIIIGLPGESRQEVLDTTAALADLAVDGVKLHLLHVLEGTVLGDLYSSGEIGVLEQEEYVATVADVIERLPAHTLIHRLTGDGPRDRLLAPLWSLNKWEVLNAIDAELERRGTWQGTHCSWSGEGGAAAGKVSGRELPGGGK